MMFASFLPAGVDAIALAQSIKQILAFVFWARDFYPDHLCLFLTISLLQNAQSGGETRKSP